jgi:RyR domain
LEQIGCTIGLVSELKGKAVEFIKSEIETLAEMEHGRWVVERLRDGWKMAAERDALKKKNPYLVAKSALPDDIKEYERETDRRISEFLAKPGLAIWRKK